jgi:hypothetical protein
VPPGAMFQQSHGQRETSGFDCWKRALTRLDRDHRVGTMVHCELSCNRLVTTHCTGGEQQNERGGEAPLVVVIIEPEKPGDDLDLVRADPSAIRRWRNGVERISRTSRRRRG